MELLRDTCFFKCFVVVVVVSALNGMPAWTPSVSSELLPQYGLAVMRSNRWPGAVAFAKDRCVVKCPCNYTTILLVLVFIVCQLELFFKMFADGKVGKGTGNKHRNLGKGDAGRGMAKVLSVGQKGKHLATLYYIYITEKGQVFLISIYNT